MSQAALHWRGAVLNDDGAWNTFVRRHGTLPQSAAWGNFKQATGWQVTRRVHMNGGAIVGGVQLLTRHNGLGLRVGVIRGGPLSLQASIATALMREVQSLAHLVVWQPPLDGHFSAEMIRSLGFQPNPIRIVPRATVVCDLTQSEAALLANMRKKTRYWVRRTGREGVTVRQGTRADVTLFHRLHQESAAENGYTPDSLTTYQTMWDQLDGYLQLFVAEVAGEPIAAQLLSAFGDTVTTKRTGWRRDFAAIRPMIALDWAAMRWAKRCGYRFYDFEGIEQGAANAILAGQPLPEHFLHTPTFYKLGFGGAARICAPTYFYARNPVVRLISSHLLSQSWVRSVTDFLHERLI